MCMAVWCPQSFNCDVCHTGPLPAGAKMYGCREEDWDMCKQCYADAIAAPTNWVTREDVLKGRPRDWSLQHDAQLVQLISRCGEDWLQVWMAASIRLGRRQFEPLLPAAAKSGFLLLLVGFTMCGFIYLSCCVCICSSMFPRGRF